MIEDPLGVGGHGWVVGARGKGSSSLDCSQCILEMRLMVSWVWQLKFHTGLIQLHLESKLKLLNFLLIRMVEKGWGIELLKKLLYLEEGFFHEKGEEYQLIQLIL